MNITYALRHTESGVVVLDFSQKVKGLNLGPNEARKIAGFLMEEADRAERHAANRPCCGHNDCPQHGCREIKT